MRAASAASDGLPRSWPSTTTTVSAPNTTSCGRCRATASAFSRASRWAQSFAASPGSGSSGMSAGCISNVIPALRSNSWRRGDAEASTSMGVLPDRIKSCRDRWQLAAAELCPAWTGEAPVRTRTTRSLLQLFGLDRNVLLAFGALFPVFFYPGFVAFAGGGVASGEGDGGDLGIRDGGALAAGEHQSNHRILEGRANAAVEKISSDLGAVFVCIFIFASDSYVAAIIKRFFDDCPDIGFAGELRDPSLKIFVLESGDNFKFVGEFVVGAWRRSNRLRAVWQQRIVTVFATAHTRLSSACGEGASICTSGL